MPTSAGDGKGMMVEWGRVQGGSHVCNPEGLTRHGGCLFAEVAFRNPFEDGFPINTKLERRMNNNNNMWQKIIEREKRIQKILTIMVRFFIIFCT